MAIKASCLFNRTYSVSRIFREIYLYRDLAIDNDIKTHGENQGEMFGIQISQKTLRLLTFRGINHIESSGISNSYFICLQVQRVEIGKASEFPTPPNTQPPPPSPGPGEQSPQVWHYQRFLL